MWNEDSGVVTVYILDGECKAEVPVAGDTVAIDLKIGENTETRTLDALVRAVGTVAYPTAKRKNSHFRRIDDPAGHGGGLGDSSLVLKNSARCAGQIATDAVNS